MRFLVISWGKTRERYWLEALAEYQKRMGARLELEEIGREKMFIRRVQHFSRPFLLDARGQMYTSEQFSHLLYDSLTRQDAVIPFVIGGAEGFPPALCDQGPKISLSPMTLTHQMCRVLLVEQLYRAWKIQENSPYHKDFFVYPKTPNR